MLGQKARTLINSQISQPAGYYDILWDSRDDNGQPVASGIYFYRLETKSNSQTYVKTRKMMLMK